MRNRVRLSPKDFTDKQKLFYKYALENKYSILAVDPRLGKSGVAISVRQKLKINCLIICPSYLILNWKKEIEKWTGSSDFTTVFRKGKDIYEVCDSDFVITSFDLVQKAEHLFDWCDMLIIDETHNLKSMKAKRTQFIHRCIFEYSIPRLLLLSGTIIKNRVQEFYSQLAMANYNPELKDSKFLDLFPDEIAFADRFSYRSEYKIRGISKKGYHYENPVVKWQGIQRIPELKKLLKGKYIRVKADDSDLPPITEKTVLISDSDDKNLLKAFNDFFDDEDMQSVKPEVKLEAAMKKVPFTIKYIEDLKESVDCLLVYSDHVPVIEEIAKHFGVKAITGKMTATARARMATEFQDGQGEILCATIGSLKEGQDLFRSRDIVFNDYSWNVGDIKQVINRIRGLGQKSPRTIHNLFGSPQDEKIWKALAEKRDVIEKAT